MLMSKKVVYLFFLISFTVKASFVLLPMDESSFVTKNLLTANEAFGSNFNDDDDVPF